MPSPYRNSSMRHNGRTSCAKPCTAMHCDAHGSSMRIADDLHRHSVAHCQARSPEPMVDMRTIGVDWVPPCRSSAFQRRICGLLPPATKE